MAITHDDVFAIAPELSSLDPAVVTIFIADAAMMMTRAAWGERADLGQKYLTAHLLTAAGHAPGSRGSGGLGIVTSETVGPVSRTYASPTGSSTDSDSLALSSSRYGTIYKALKRQLGVHFAAVG